jgi:hypothetical protein
MPRWSLKDMFSRLQGSNASETDGASGDASVSPSVSSANGDIAGDLSMDDGAPISPLALMDESRPESWLGNFLTIIGAPPALQYNTLKAARADERLREHLQEVWIKASQDNPSLLLDPAGAAALKDQDWGAWWRGQEALGRYAYSTLALAMLGDRTHLQDLVALYSQDYNARIKKDTHYVLTFLLGKPWPSYTPTAGDLAKLADPQP